jgi:hypothetical protein
VRCGGERETSGRFEQPSAEPKLPGGTDADH